MATSTVVPEVIDEQLQRAQKRLADLQHQQAAEKFVAANPSYEANPENQRLMQEHLRASDFDPTYEGLEAAYNTLKAQGRITIPPGIEDKPTTELSAYQRELADRVRRAQEEIERGQRQMRERQSIAQRPAPANQFLQSARNPQILPGRTPRLAPDVVLTPQEKLRQSLKAVHVPQGRRVKDAINNI